MTTKDHNRLSEFKGVDQLYRWSEIPSSNQVNQRIEFYNDYLLALNPDTTYGLVEQVTKHYTDFPLNIILGTLNNNWYNSITQGKTKTSLAYVRTDGFLEVYQDGAYKYAIATPVASYGVKGGFVFEFGFDNNQVAGNGLYFDGTNYYNNAVRYTDRDGRFNELWFSLANKYSNTGDGYTESQRENAYPLVRTNQNDFGSLNDIYFKSGAPNIYDTLYDALIIEKDSSQSVKVSYQNTVISYDYLKYVFGQKFYSENYVVKNPKIEYNVVKGTNKYLYRYTNGTKYGKFDDLKVKSGWNSKILLSSSNASISSNNSLVLSSSMVGVTSWAIGDNDGNLYLACNANYSGVRLVKRHFRQGMNEIGNKNPSQAININITMVDGISISSVIETIHPSNYNDEFTDNFDVIDRITIIQSTDFVIDLEDEISVFSASFANQFTFPIVTLEGQLDLLDTIEITKSTNFVINLTDDIYALSSLGISVSDDYLIQLSSDIATFDTIELIQSTDFVVELEDYLSVDSEVESTYYQLLVLDLSGSVDLRDTIELIQSTNYVVEIPSTVSLYDTIEIIKSTDFVITLSDTVLLESDVVVVRSASSWSYIETSGSYNETVSNIAGGSTCNTSATIDTWLETNYPANGYSVGYIMRVFRTNVNESPCSPLFYFYQAI
jgi:hypothetical protein